MKDRFSAQYVYQTLGCLSDSDNPVFILAVGAQLMVDPQFFILFKCFFSRQQSQRGEDAYGIGRVLLLHAEGTGVVHPEASVTSLHGLSLAVSLGREHPGLFRCLVRCIWLLRRFPVDRSDRFVNFVEGGPEGLEVSHTVFHLLRYAEDCCYLALFAARASHLVDLSAGHGPSFPRLLCNFIVRVLDHLLGNPQVLFFISSLGSLIRVYDLRCSLADGVYHAHLFPI